MNTNPGAPPARRPILGLTLTLTITLFMTACSTKTQRGGYYQNDGPGAPLSARTAAATPDAVPRIEPHAPANSRPYTINGKRYVPLTGSHPFSQEGIASWYGRQFHGKKTASGERYDMYAMSAAHPTLPLPSYARITRLDSGKSIIVRINDRGPFKPTRVIDLSYAAAAKLGFINQGSTRVRVQAITHDDIRKGRSGIPANAGAETTAETNANTQSTHTPTAPPSVYLQFGAFTQLTNAQALLPTLAAQLSADHHPPLHIHQTNNLYRVRIGPYPTRSEALTAAERIRQQTGRVVSLGY